MEEHTLERIADLICGDASITPVYRSSWHLTRFFEGVGLPRFKHDGSTRKWWVLGCLKECSDEELNKVILGLASPKTYKGNVEHLELVLTSLNEVLNPEGLEIQIMGVKPVLNKIEPRLSRPLNLYSKKENKEHINRVFVFIDGENLLVSAKSLGVTIDFAKLRNILSHKFGSINWITYYSANLHQSANQQKFENMLLELGYQINLAKGSTKSVDALLTIDAISLSTEYDTIVLLSGDGDFIPLLQNLKQQGKKTVVVSLKIANRELINVSAEFYSLENLISEPAPVENPLEATNKIKSPSTLISNRPLHVFLCHSSSDKAAVRDIYFRLGKENNISPWLDEKNILPGQDWDYEINKAIRESDVVIICCSKNSVSKEGYVQKEVVRALDIANEKPEGVIFIIPLKLDECQIPNRLSRWHWVNYFDDGGYELLMRSLRHREHVLTS